MSSWKIVHECVSNVVGGVETSLWVTLGKVTKCTHFDGVTRDRIEECIFYSKTNLMNSFHSESKYEQT